jgi:DNA (cytosine-5)-methyltransferase 1
MGLEPGHVTDVPGLTRAERLHVIGNGAMPRQAYAAYAHLLELIKEPAND